MSKLPPKRRFPPGQVETEKWPVLDLGDQPSVSNNDWALSVSGLVNNPIRWRWVDFLARPQTDGVSDIHCVTTWSRFDNHWRGVSTKHLLSLIEPKRDAAYLIFKGYDDYVTNVPLK